jgi:hypothetical protein
MFDTTHLIGRQGELEERDDLTRPQLSDITIGMMIGSGIALMAVVAISDFGPKYLGSYYRIVLFAVGATWCTVGLETLWAPLISFRHRAGSKPKALLPPPLSAQILAPTTSIVCSACGHRNQARNVFCGSCGRPLSSEWACASCGQKNPAGDGYCGNCGRPIGTKLELTSHEQITSPGGF